MASLAQNTQDIDHILEYFNDLSNALLFYCNPPYPNPDKFLGYTFKEIDDFYAERVGELNITCCLSVMAAVEAVFRVDYRLRHERRKKDDLSRALRDLYKRRKERASLEDEIMEIWKRSTNEPKYILGDAIGALKFRHWIAHGRYWIPKLGQRYDFVSIYSLASTVLNTFPFEKP